jgi:hypothetical protein
MTVSRLSMHSRNEIQGWLTSREASSIVPTASQANPTSTFRSTLRPDLLGLMCKLARQRASRVREYFDLIARVPDASLRLALSFGPRTALRASLCT